VQGQLSAFVRDEVRRETERMEADFTKES